MFFKSAALYDRIYGSFKDYEQECHSIHNLIQQKHESAQTLLDVACGTGEHAHLLKGLFGYQVDGIDLDADLIKIAKDKNPDGAFCQSDMVDFEMRKKYDVVMCLFSSIGYVKTLDRVVDSLNRFKEHTKDGGIIVVEPWFQPGALTPGKIFLNTFEDEEFSVARMGYSQVNDKLSTLHFEYLIGVSGSVTHEIETHELGLFTVDEMINCFQQIGLTVDYDEEGLSGRGLYISEMG